MIHLNHFVRISTAISLGISLITLSNCSPRGSVTQAQNPTQATRTQASFTPTGTNNQPLYQDTITSAQLGTPMSPITSPHLASPMGNVDNIATGSIAPQASLSPSPANIYPYEGTTTSKVNTTQYTVQAGDTIYSIGRKFNIHPNQIIAHNSLLNPNNLVVGQTFTVPVNGNANIKPKINAMQSVQKSVPTFGGQNNVSQNYTVQSGDTLYSIGRKFNINPNYIISKNPNINPNYLAPGQVLNIVSNISVPTKEATITTAQTVKNKLETPQATQVTPTKAQNIMGLSASKDDNLEKQILSNALSLPVSGSIKENKNLRGVLISAADGDAVKASAAGEVIYVGNLNNYGNMILVKHDNGLVTNYARLKKTFVQKGQKVSKGDLIASAGISKEFNTSDVLFEVRKGTKAVNPLDYIG